VSSARREASIAVYREIAVVSTRAREDEGVTFSPKLAAALSGATLGELARWRRTGVLVPEISAERPVLYSFRDVVAVRICIKLGGDVPLRRVRQALDVVGDDLDLLSGAVAVVDVVVQDVPEPFDRGDRRVPALLRPRDHVRVDPGIRGGEPVIEGTRVPYGDIAGLLRDGVPAERISEFYPGVTAEAARDAADLAEYVDSMR
jgi:uncharacterized protein (DUF433 family)